MQTLNKPYGGTYSTYDERGVPLTSSSSSASASSASSAHAARTPKRHTATEEVPVDDDSVAVAKGCCTYGLNTSNMLYGLLLLIGATLAVVLKHTEPKKIFVGLFSFDVCSEDVCYGNSAVYRISCGFFLFFLVNLLVCCCCTDFHVSYWPWKYTIFTSIFTLMFFLPGEIFIIFREFSRYTSFIYLIIQMFILINLVYTIHHALLSRMDSSKAYRYAYIALFFGSIIASVALAVCLYIYYADCTLHRIIIGSLCAIGVITIFVSSTEAVGKGVLTPALLLAYLLVQCYQSLHSNPDAACNPYADDKMSIWQFIVLLCFNVISIVWNTTRTATSITKLFHADKVRENASDEDSDVEGVPAKPTARAGTSVAVVHPSNMFLLSRNAVLSFHFVMMMAGCYFAMLITGWGNEHTKTLNNPEANEQSFWIKVINNWTTYAFYIWTLIAPFVFPDRDFS